MRVVLKRDGLVLHSDKYYQCVGEAGGRGVGGGVDVGDEVCECGVFICMLHVWVCIYVRETETDPSEC